MAFFWLRDGDRGKALARVRHSRPRDRYPSISSMFNTARGHGATPTPSDYAQIGRHDFSGKIDSPPPVGSRPTTKATYGRRCSRPCRTTVLRVLFFFFGIKKNRKSMHDLLGSRPKSLGSDGHWCRRPFRAATSRVLSKTPKGQLTTPFWVATHKLGNPWSLMYSPCMPS